MASKRKTVDRAELVDTANRMILHLAGEYGTTAHSKRAAIVSLTSSVLLAGNSYKGFSYLSPPFVRDDGTKLYDETRIRFN